MARPAPTVEQERPGVPALRGPAVPSDRPFTIRVRQAFRVGRAQLAPALVILCAFFQGMLYLALLPPWQHYDEPTHFEHAWLIAARGRLPEYGDMDQTMRREVAASMLANDFYWNLPRPNLLADHEQIWIGIYELGHPPTYYALVSLPLRLARHLDLTSQLYIARAVSLLLFLITIGITIGMMRDLTPGGHPLRWAVPLGITLIPTFADVMTSVNSDVAAIAVFSFFLWGAVRVIRYGITWRRLVMVFGSALLAAATKNTAAFALVVAPLVVLIALWAQRGWRWRWLVACSAGAGSLLLLIVLGWGDSAYWYRWGWGEPQFAATRAESPAATAGTHVFVLEAPPAVGDRRLSTPLLEHDVRRIAGKTVTIGGWVWADRPATIRAPGVAVTSSMSSLRSITQVISVTTTPAFVAATIQVPEQTRIAQYMFYAQREADGQGPGRVYLDGAVLVEGAFPAATPPVFDDATAHSGTWGGRRFVNLVRNASAEQAAPRLRPELDSILYRYIHRSPSQTIMALLDVQRLQEQFIEFLALPTLKNSISNFAWGHVRVANPLWIYLEGGIAFAALIGTARWFIRSRRGATPRLRVALIFLAIVGGLAWCNTMLRPLPLLGETFVFPVARYAFPAIIPTVCAIAGGWWALWPRRMRRYALPVLLIGLFALNIAAILAIQTYYRTVAVAL